jgi:hypothetical protein
MQATAAMVVPEMCRVILNKTWSVPAIPLNKTWSVPAIPLLSRSHAEQAELRRQVGDIQGQTTKGYPGTDHE